jgi:hypothetical protein
MILLLVSLGNMSARYTLDDLKIKGLKLCLSIEPIG